MAGGKLVSTKVRVGFLAEQAFVDRIEEASVAMGLSMSEVMREAVNRYLCTAK